ncbi:hypothetical protein GOODEAATRI_034260 [Goodea atripinnis]|uniref:Uncharacterized protein n=1 Tax=Goodea atripinnis TaxID=208336 RepID=A0ABV0MP80_9TELE
MFHQLFESGKYFHLVFLYFKMASNNWEQLGVVSTVSLHQEGPGFNSWSEVAEEASLVEGSRGEGRCLMSRERSNPHVYVCVCVCMCVRGRENGLVHGSDFA